MLEWMGGGIVTFKVGPDVKLFDELLAGDKILHERGRAKDLERPQRASSAALE